MEVSHDFLPFSHPICRQIPVGQRVGREKKICRTCEFFTAPQRSLCVFSANDSLGFLIQTALMTLSFLDQSLFNHLSGKPETLRQTHTLKKVFWVSLASLWWVAVRRPFRLLPLFKFKRMIKKGVRWLWCGVKSLLKIRHQLFVITSK